MNKFRTQSSSDEGELSKSEAEDEEWEELKSFNGGKVTNRKLWSNVMLDQTADDLVAGVNSFEGACGNRSVESFDIKNTNVNVVEDLRSVLNKSPVINYGLNNEVTESKRNLEGETSSAGPEKSNPDDSGSTLGRKRKRVVYDVSNNGSEDEDMFDNVDAVVSAPKPTGNIVKELDVTLEEVIMQTSAFLTRAAKLNWRPACSCSTDELLQYLIWVLNEQNVDLLKRLINLKSVKWILNTLDVTIEKEKAGGMMTNTGIRKRLPGGVFISILKGRLNNLERMIVLDGKTESEAKTICERNVKKKNKKRNAKKRAKMEEAAAAASGGSGTKENRYVSIEDGIIETINELAANDNCDADAGSNSIPDQSEFKVADDADDELIIGEDDNDVNTVNLECNNMETLLDT